MYSVKHCITVQKVLSLNTTYVSLYALVITMLCLGYGEEEPKLIFPNSVSFIFKQRRKGVLSYPSLLKL